VSNPRSTAAKPARGKEESVKSTAIATAVAVTLGAVALVPAAHARNPHCAGGIQYVVQALRDKDKGNLDDYKREINKAVEQLTMCSTEDPADFEAIGYLGWALAEIDSSCQAGVAFDKAIAGLQTKDPKKVDWAKTNRESYWANAYNGGITKINEAREAYPDYLKLPENDSDKTLKAEAKKKYDEAAASLNRAACLKPNDPRTMKNLGSVYMFTGEYNHAVAAFDKGLSANPNDSMLVDAKKAALQAQAGALIDAKKFDEAVAFYEGLIKSDPNNSDLYLGVAEAQYKKATSTEGDAKKPVFKAAGDAYAKAASLKPNNVDLPFNAALSYTNAGDLPAAEAQWRAVLKIKPDDPEALSALGSVLADLKKFDEAVKVLQRAVAIDAKNATYHRQLGAAYTKSNQTAKATEEFMLVLALTKGKAAEDAAATAKKAPAGSAAAKTLASMSTPEQVYVWESDGQRYETWIYWAKSQALHFNPQGVQVQKSDWSAANASAGK
jgi:tetratricopeptide (TPR) repeat protein